MIHSVKEVMKKLEIGLLEIFLGVLMVIGLIGYFSSIPADLEWLDHTISFVLFGYLFYKISITSVLVGKKYKQLDLIIVISYFSFFFKDVLNYTQLSAFKFSVIHFVDSFYLFFTQRPFLANYLPVYIGIAGLLFASFCLSFDKTVKKPSLIYAIKVDFKSRIVKFCVIILLLFAFYYFVFNLILEWLEFVIDDPVIATGIIFYIYRISRHHQKFEKDKFIFKIGSFSTRIYSRFISLFHSKKTLALAISGLLVLHALADFGVFAYSYIFMAKNPYIEQLGEGHEPFFTHFILDLQNTRDFAVIPLLILYFLNALSLVIFLLIPVVVWVRMFMQRQLHFNKVLLFFIYSATAAYVFLPAYRISMLSKENMIGVDIQTISLLQSGSIINSLFPDKNVLVLCAAMTCILFGLIVYFLSHNGKARKELFALSIIIGMIFYAHYIYSYFISVVFYFGSNIFDLALAHFIIAAMLFVLLALSFFFYIMGFLMFLYEIVMEYHRRKWSGSIDEEIIVVISKIKRGKIFSIKRGSFDITKFVFAIVVSVAVIISGYKILDIAREKSCQSDIEKFALDLKGIDKELKYGAKETKTFTAPCDIEKIYFVDLNEDHKDGAFSNVPEIADSISSFSNKNVFLIKDNKVINSFYAGNVKTSYPYNLCLKPKFERISFFAEGIGNSAKIYPVCEQPDCTEIPVEISDEDARRIVQEAAYDASGNLVCNACLFDYDLQNIRLTRESIDIIRRYSVCNGITTVEIILSPKEALRDFRYYEFIPKDCINSLSEFLEGQIGLSEKIILTKDDPLIVWQFNELRDETTIGFKLKNTKEQCLEIIKGLGVAKFIENEIAPPPAIIGQEHRELSLEMESYLGNELGAQMELDENRHNTGNTEDNSCRDEDCNDPQRTRCLDPLRLISYSSYGRCEQNSCTYDSTVYDCESGCSEDRCNNDLCLGISCESYDECLDVFTLKNYQNGRCNPRNGLCNYGQARDVRCSDKNGICDQRRCKCKDDASSCGNYPNCIQCQEDESCINNECKVQVQKCSDGTPVSSCSISRKWCDQNKNLVNDCTKCPCSQNSNCNPYTKACDSCEPTYFQKRCGIGAQKDIIYWYDKCSRQVEQIFDCDENSMYDDCKNGECCIKFFITWDCDDPTSGCIPECRTGQSECLAYDSFRECVRVSGCRKWSNPIRCSSSQYCVSGYCEDIEREQGPIII